MGCCEGRYNTTSERSTISVRLKQNRRTGYALTQELLDNSVVNEENTNSDGELSPFIEEPIYLQLNVLKINRNWREISKWINKTEIVYDIGTEKSQGWAKNPKSIGSLAIAYLAEAACESPNIIQEFLPDILDSILLYINFGSEDMRDYSLLFLYHALESSDEDTFLDLINRDVFSILTPLLSSQVRQIRLLSIAICARIYRNRERGQKLFFKYRAENELVQLLVRDGESDDILCVLLEHIIDLVLVNAI